MFHATLVYVSQVEGLNHLMNRGGIIMIFTLEISLLYSTG